MIRFLGAIMVFSALASLGGAAAHMYRIRAEQLEAFHELILHIGAQIDGFLMPLDAIYSDFRNRTLAESGFSALLCEHGGERALVLCKTLMLTEDEREVLIKFFSELGRHGADEEMRCCAYYEKKIGGAAASARGGLAGKGRLCRAMGVLAGILLAVILI